MKKTALLLTLFISLVCSAQTKDVRYTEQDVANFNQIMQLLGTDKQLPMDQTVMKVAMQLLGTPYLSFTLEQEPEMLTVNTRQTDCILFVEMCLAMGLTSKMDKPTFDDYCDNLRMLRYRNGIVDGYDSRIHYTSEWIRQAEGRGIMHEITSEIGGVLSGQRFNFMSNHPDSYKQMVGNAKVTKGIKAMEENLNRFSDYYYIPKADLPSSIKYIKDGDIICFNDSHEGLDIAHVAYAYWRDGELTFIHASMADKKVEINPVPLIEYTNRIKGHNGLRVVRLK